MAGGRSGVTDDVIEQFLNKAAIILEAGRLPRADVRVISCRVDKLRPLAGIFLGQQALDRLLRREIRVAVVIVAIGKCQVHGLVDRVDIANCVVPHVRDVEVFENIERLEHHRALGPRRQFVDVDTSIVCRHRLLDVNLPLIEIAHRDQATLFLGGTDEFLGDVAAIEAVVGGINGGLAVLAGRERRAFSLDQLLEGCL